MPFAQVCSLQLFQNNGSRLSFTGQRQDDDGEQKADRDGSADLSSANATPSQIDLIVATICPLLVSTVIHYGDPF